MIFPTIEVSALVPGGIFTDLQNDGILKESIYYRFNDVNYRWVSKESWTYFVHFTIDNEKILNGKNVELVFHGLDGIAKISLNNQVLGQVDNTFVRYRFDVTEKLSHTNYLEINFESPIHSAKRLSQTASHSVPPKCLPSAYRGECHVNFLRRVQASFAWDWGLAMPSVGIWKEVELIAYDEDVIVQDIAVSTVSDGDYWKVFVRVNCSGPLRATSDITGSIDVSIFEKENVALSSRTDILLSSNSLVRNIVATLNISVPKASVELWWPNGYGPQKLYPLSAVFSNGKQENEKRIQIGFREAKLIQERVNKKNAKQGLTFFFNVNNVEIFAKGSNYIPSNILLEHTCDKKTIRHLLESAKNSNMNILRIWGGGMYECDYFYELCDEYGILIWQDMMFACSMYPVDNSFLASVNEEITQQIWRLQHHASIILWAGNNENEAALKNNWYGTWLKFSLFKKEYVHLYVDVVKKAVLAVDQSRYFMASSPSNGLQSEAEGYVSSNPYDPLYGDVHFFDYNHDSWLIDNYPMTRFASEYGYQSLPSYSTLQKVTTPEDLRSFKSKFFQHRQHSPGGQRSLIHLISFHFAAPPSRDVENFIHVSQINQAWSVKSQTEWYRKWRGTLLPNGKGRTMGAMYWQLNDIWQAPSWSSIEFGGKWKMLQYYAKKFFEPVIVTGDLDRSGSITINVISDKLNDIPNAELLIYLYNWNSMTPVDTISHSLVISKESSQRIMKTSVRDLIESNPKCKSRKRPYGSKCFVKLTLQKENSIIHENFLFPRSFKKVIGLQNCKIQTQVDSCTLENCVINVQTDSIGLFVWLDAKNIDGYFSDNGFIMTDSLHKIYFYSEKQISRDQLQNSLSATWLNQKKN
ncbi:hypothetical protein V9T40_012908 [Parthenolecanium corni]|uniref:Beta-mannosidase n=1 Tax=Parthenolecanium corni TaxID=536013 RepID=A0AAN9T858_9HEMI